MSERTREERQAMPPTMTLMRFGGGYPFLITTGFALPWLATKSMFNDQGQRIIPFPGEGDEGGHAA